MKDRPQLSQGRQPEATGPGRGHGLPRAGDPDGPTVVHRGSLEPRVATACLEPAEEGASPRTCRRPGPGLGHQTLPTPPPCVSGPGSAHSTWLGPSLFPNSPVRRPDRPHSDPPHLGALSPMEAPGGATAGALTEPPGGGHRGRGTGRGRSRTPSRSLEPQAPGTTPQPMKASPPWRQERGAGPQAPPLGEGSGVTCLPPVKSDPWTHPPACSRGRPGGRSPRPFGRE